MGYKSDLAATIAALQETDTRTITCSVADIVATASELKKTRTACNGTINLVLTDRTEGLNCRKIDKTDSRKVYNALKPICWAYAGHPNMAKPFIDVKFNSMVATNGVVMVAMDRPIGLEIEPNGKDKGLFYRNGDEHIVSWLSIVGSHGLDDSDYYLALLDYDKIGEIEKGGSLHNLVATAALCERQYMHHEKGSLKTIGMLLDGKWISPMAMLKIIRAMLSMGCESIDIYSRKTVGVWEVKSKSPLRLVGRGAGVRITGMLMPFRSVSSGLTIVFPNKEKERDAT